MRKLIFVLLLLLLGSTLTVMFLNNSFAEEDLATKMYDRLTNKTIVMKINNNKAYTNNLEVRFDNDSRIYPFLVEQRAFVPVRFICENLGARVEWNESLKAVNIDYNDNIVEFVVGSRTAVVNGDYRQVDIPATIINDRVFVQLRPLVEILKKEVFWHNSGLIIISDNKNIINEDTEKDLLKMILVRFNDNLSQKSLLINTFNEYTYKLDGAYAEGYAYRLVDLFTKDMEIFISVLGDYSNKQIDGILKLLVWELSYHDDFNEIIKRLEKFKAGKEINESEYNVVSVFMKNIEDVINTQKNEIVRGNIVNQGIIGRQGEWIYYRNDYDNGSIYKMKQDGSSKLKLNNDESHFINIEGDWIYYSNWNDGYKLYRVKTNGTQRAKLNNDDSQYINVSEGWIYYSSYPSKGLYKINIDGSKKSRLTDDVCEYVCLSDGWLYYKNDGNDSALYKVRTDGNDRTKINNDHSNYINVYDGWIYYCNGSDDGKIYKAKIDGSFREKVCDDRACCINILNNWIYYFNGSDDIKLYKIRTDGTYRAKLSDDWGYNINIDGNWLYYENWSDDAKLYRIKNDGTERTKVN